MLNRTWLPVATLSLSLAPAATVLAAGTLSPLGSPEAPVRIVDHHVDVVITNGFAKTEVTQTFFNPNDTDLEAIYSFPVPRSASLSEFSIYAGETEINGEVLTKDQARRIYGEERDKGRDTGLAEKNSFYTFDFHVSPVRAQTETRFRFLYYQPVEIDTGMGRYLYPLEEGGTDDAALRFWTTNDVVESTLSARIELKSVWPLEAVRMPGFEGEAQVEKLGDGHYICTIERESAKLNKDLVLYYRLPADLPGRVEIVSHRADPNGPGTFMAIVTPGLDLQPLDRGSDYVFVLDVSGSMNGGKIATLTRGVSQVITDLRPQDRYRIITFNNRAKDLTRGFQSATPEAVKQSLEKLAAIRAKGSTNLYEGIQLALDDLDADRATSVVLVTDAVTNTGVVDPKRFHALLSNYDLRLFGFLIGNSGNWPLMRSISEATGGFHTQVSNADDILGQIMLAKSKVTHESLHGATLHVRGIDVSDTTGAVIGKVYRGQQLVLLGRFHEAGPARIVLEASLTGRDRVYETSFDFPTQDDRHPEIERIWAMSLIEALEDQANAGLLDADEMRDAVRGLGVEFQLVTDETAMIVLDDASFARRGIDRRNRERVGRELAAQQARASQPIVSQRVDRKTPMFDRPAPSLGGGAGGGAINPVFGLVLLALGALGASAASRSVRRS